MLKRHLGFIISGGLISAAILIFSEPETRPPLGTPQKFAQAQPVSRTMPQTATQTMAVTASPASIDRVGDQIREVRFSADRLEEQVADLMNDLARQHGIELGKPHIRQGEYSSQVFVQQTLRGRPIEPAGRLTVDVSKNGTVVDVYSTLANISGVVGGTTPLDSAAVLTQNGITPESVESEREVYWMKRRSAQTEVVRAYAVVANGVEWVFEASTGRRLSRRDLRRF